MFYFYFISLSCDASVVQLLAINMFNKNSIYYDFCIDFTILTVLYVIDN